MCVYFQHGKVTEVRIVTHKSGAPKGIAYIQYEDEVTSHPSHPCLSSVGARLALVRHSIVLVRVSALCRAGRDEDGRAASRRTQHIRGDQQPSRPQGAGLRALLRLHLHTLPGRRQEGHHRVGTVQTPVISDHT